MTRTELINKYENLMYKNGEGNLWQDDIEPKLATMSDAEIRRWYYQDAQFYKDNGGIVR